MTKEEKKFLKEVKQEENYLRNQLLELHETLEEYDTHDENDECISMMMDFSEQDMYNAASICFSICSNYAVKHDILNEKNAKQKITMFKNVLQNTFGLNIDKEAQIQQVLDAAIPE